MAIFTHAPKSDHIKLVTYDDKAGRIAVTFDHGRLKEPKTYTHSDVPLETFNAYLKWMTAGHSAGSYYHRFLAKKPIVKEVEKGVQ